MTSSLTALEKLAIDGMVVKGQSIKEIKQVLKRSAKSQVVENYLKESQPQSTQIYDHKAVLSKLASVGIHGEKALRLINIALKNCGTKPEVNEIYNEAIKNIGPRELMITESAGGVSRGITMMTEAASTASDEKMKAENAKKANRSTQGAVFHPSTGENS